MSDQQTADLNSLRVPFPRRRNRRLLDFSQSDVRYIIAGLAFVGAMSSNYGVVVLTFLLPLFFVALWRTNYSRLHKWFREELRNMWIRYALRGVLVDPDRPGRFRRSSQLFKASIESIVADGMSLGTFYDHTKREDHIFIVGDGSPYAAFDPEDMYGWLTQLGRAVVNAASEVPFKVGISTSIIRRPVDMTRHLGYLVRNVHPDITLKFLDLQEGRTPSKATAQERVDARRAENLLQLQHATAAFGSEAIMVMIISVKRPKWKTGQLTERELYRTPIAKMARMLTTDLEALDVQDPTVLDLCGVSRLFRMYWDIAGIHRYYDARATGVYPTDDSELEVDDDGNVRNELGHWMIGKIKVGPDYIFFENRKRPEEEPEDDPALEGEQEEEAEGTYARTLMLVGTRGEAMPDEFEPIKTIEDGWTAITSVAETMPGQLESAMLTRKIGLRRAMTEWKESNYETPEEQEAREDEETEHQELHRGGNVVQKANNLITIVATSLDEVQDIQDRYEAAFRSQGLRSMVVDGECRQPRAFISGMGVSQL